MRNDRYAATYPEVAWGAGMSQRVFDTRVLPLFGMGLLLTGIVSYIARGLPNGIALAAGLVAFVMAWTSGKWMRSENHALNFGLFFFFSALCGMMLVPLLRWAAAIGGGMLITQAFAVTGITFGGLMAVGLVVNKDFSKWGRFLLIAVLGLIVASVVNIFIGGSIMALVTSMIGVLIFSAFVLFNMSMIRHHLSDQDFMLAALMLYINFLNMFQNILVILGIMRSD
ncbi:MAG: hypothetical protein CVV27_11355 [Candidatus Melainabacteria bacterium HGW-Melainabacteria-1]|nr:MAG: hypothetical protein CVV27_11355 [Candidatus Melainabacteria bacterium HGW-Melainabacteria-1]